MPDAPVLHKIYEAINSNLFGLNKSERNSGDYQLHPLIRDDWRSVDRFKDLQGNVPALTTNANGDLIVDERVSVSGIPEGLTFYRPFKDQNADYEQIPRTHDRDTIEFRIKARPDSAEWNQGNSNTNDIPVLEDLLEQNDVGGNFSGIPYFEKFFHVQDPPDDRGPPFGLLKSDARMAGATRNIKPIMQQNWTAGEDRGDRILNHKFNYRYYDRSVQDSGYNITIESQYNLFLDTNPDYEFVISEVSEPLIPNYYHIEASINIAATEDLVIPAYDIFVSGEIGNSDLVSVLRATLSGSNVTETQNTSQGYLQYYCSNVNIFKPNYANDFGNVAVLSHDVSADVLGGLNTIVRDNRGTLSDTTDDLLAIDSYPFYNKITIPYDKQWAGGDDIIGDLQSEALGVGSEWTKYFLVLLELLIIDNYSPTATAVDSAEFTIYETTDGNKVVAQNASIDLAIRIEEVLYALINLAGDSSSIPPELIRPAQELADRIQDLFETDGQLATEGIYSYLAGYGSSHPGASFILDDPTDSGDFFDDFDSWYGDLSAAEILEALDSIGSNRRGYKTAAGNPNYYRGQGPTSNHKDTPIMYMVEKRVIPAGQLSADPTSSPVQRFFFGRDITGAEKGITYYDTQIKYGVRYQYDIKQIRMVIGEGYYYDSVKSITNSGSVGQGRALGNALGIYAEENFDITTTQTFQTANSLEDFEYTEEDSEPGAVGFDESLVGYYVYKIPPAKNLGDAENIEGIFGPVSPAHPMANPIGPLTGDDESFGPSRNPLGETDLSLLKIKIKEGEGFEGNSSGGGIAIQAASFDTLNLNDARRDFRLDLPDLVLGGPSGGPDEDEDEDDSDVFL